MILHHSLVIFGSFLTEWHRHSLQIETGMHKAYGIGWGFDDKSAIGFFYSPYNKCYGLSEELSH